MNAVLPVSLSEQAAGLICEFRSVQSIQNCIVVQLHAQCT